MWLKSFKIDDKVLSPIELLVLLQAFPDDDSVSFIEAPKIIDNLDSDISFWSPERGTIYPILHRLENQNLLVKTNTRPIRVVRTDRANQFIESLIDSDLLLQQYEATFSYLEAVAKAVVKDGSFTPNTFLVKVEEMASKLQSTISELKTMDDDWTEIQVD